MGFKIILSREAVDDLEKLSKPEVKRIIRKLQWLNKLPVPVIKAKKLTNFKNGDLRFRIGDYRMIGVVDKTKTIIIVKIGHRREIYRN
ncbi:MAG: type II toxin-antitoxin system RelE/ParE family toxin [Candidatus Uhrbacteria bacterium]